MESPNYTIGLLAFAPVDNLDIVSSKNTRRIRVCLVTAFPPQRKGEAEYARKYVDAIDRFQQKRLFTYITAQRDSDSSANADLPINPSANSGLERVFDSRSVIDRNLAFLKILSRISKVKPDLVHLTYGPNTDYGGRIGEPLLILLFFLKLLRIPIVVTLHSAWLPIDVEKRSIELGHSKIVAKLAVIHFFMFIKMFTSLTNKVLLLTASQGSKLTAEYIKAYGLSPDRIGEEPHGCDFDPNDFNRRTEIAQKTKDSLGVRNKKLVFSFGFIRSDKGLENLMYAFSTALREINDAVLLIAGTPKSNQDRDYLAYLLRLKKELGLGAEVIFDTRYVPESELKRYIKAADVVVFSYLRNLGASGPLHYAISQGAPIIATDVGYLSAMQDVVELVPPEDSTELSEAIIKLLTDREIVSKQRSQQRLYSQTHSWERVIDSNLKIYESVLKHECSVL